MSSQFPPLDLSMTVNGEERSITVPPRYLLSDLLREELRVTSVKRACDTGKCGACTVLLDDKPVKSCSLLAGQAEGHAITTIDDLGSDAVGRTVLEAYRRNHALQCGFCTSGFLLSTVALLTRNPDPTREEIQEALQGNICRCTGYTRIVQAVEDAAVRLKDTVSETDAGGGAGAGSEGGAETEMGSKEERH